MRLHPSLGSSRGRGCAGSLAHAHMSNINWTQKVIFIKKIKVGAASVWGQRGSGELRVTDQDTLYIYV